MSVFALAVLAVGVTALWCWRHVVGAVAAHPVSDRVRLAVGLTDSTGPSEFCAADFAVVEQLYAASGALAGFGRRASVIRAYYMIVRSIGGLVPVLAHWSEHEMTVCVRYLAVRIDGFLASNAACSRRVRFP
jgi:hypothetical protein